MSAPTPHPLRSALSQIHLQVRLRSTRRHRLLPVAGVHPGNLTHPCRGQSVGPNPPRTGGHVAASCNSDSGTLAGPAVADQVAGTGGALARALQPDPEAGPSAGAARSWGHAGRAQRRTRGGQRPRAQGLRVWEETQGESVGSVGRLIRQKACHVDRKGKKNGRGGRPSHLGVGRCGRWARQ